MKYSCITTILLFLSLSVFSQISHGGSPLFLESGNSLRSSSSNFFVEMPSFDVNQLLEEDKLNDDGLRGSFRFAKKFIVDIERGKDGENYTLPDGTKVWQVGIRSSEAYSINVLFSEFKIPRGGKLFLYNSDKTHVLGSFTHENNSEENILPVRPVSGDEIIVEYSEPANAAFEGKLKISEVNHDYRGILKSEPTYTPGYNFTCMPHVLCADPDNKNINATVLVIINGTSSCTGSILNNVKNDGTPYLLTAVHCLNDNFKIVNPDYAEVAGTIVTFFNYNQPVCAVPMNMKGTEEMSVAGAYSRCIIEKNDMALLELKDQIPDYYQPYFSGWNVSSNGGSAPYVNLHHPRTNVKRFGEYDEALQLASFDPSLFNTYSHWRIKAWTNGSTAPGSSGSPLYDQNGLVVGGLSGGGSLCNSSGGNNGLADYFFALTKSWEYGSDPQNQLKTYLDPDNSGLTQWDGIDMNESDPFTRLNNALYNEGDTLKNDTISKNNFIFGNSNLPAKEFAEEFSTDGDAEVYGTYMLIPQLERTPVAGANIKGVKVSLYNGELSPANKIDSVEFLPTYVDYNKSGSFVDSLKIMYSLPTETFVKFNKINLINGKFYISYEVTSDETKFSVYNTAFGPQNKNKVNTAWVKTPEQGWVGANDYSNYGKPTSLALQPLIKYTNGRSIENPILTNEKNVWFNRENNGLMVDGKSGENGFVEVYTITGYLVSKQAYSANSPLVIKPMSKGSVGIVKVLSGKDIQVLKIIF